MLTQRKEIDRIFEEAAGSEEALSVDQLVAFLQHQQRGEAAGPALALSLIERYEPSETGEGHNGWGDGTPRVGCWREAGFSASPRALGQKFPAPRKQANGRQGSGIMTPPPGRKLGEAGKAGIFPASLLVPVQGTKL